MILHKVRAKDDEKSTINAFQETEPKYPFPCFFFAYLTP